MHVLVVQPSAAIAAYRRREAARRGIDKSWHTSPGEAVPSIQVDEIIVMPDALDPADEVARARAEKWFTESVTVRLSPTGRISRL